MPSSGADSPTIAHSLHSPHWNASGLSWASTPNAASAIGTPATELDGLELGSLHSKAVRDGVIPTEQLISIRDHLIRIAKAAGKMIVAADPSVDSSDEKCNTSDRVTATDKAVEAMVYEELATHYPAPAFTFLGEETFHGQRLSNEPTFICDPIDGTLNFIHGFPNVAISLALAVNRKPVVGVVYNPFRGDLFHAVKDRGAFLRQGDGPDRPLGGNPQPLAGLSGSLVAVEWGNQRTGPNWQVRSSVATKLLTGRAEGGAMCHSVRSNGSAALDFCYVAAGWIDVFWEGGCWAWDVAAGWIVLEEAGGLVVSANPGDWNPEMEGRLYLTVRGAKAREEQQGVVEELWGLMGGQRFQF